METKYLVSIALSASLGFCGADAAAAALRVASPDGRLVLGFETAAQGMRWSLARDRRELVKLSLIHI